MEAINRVASPMNICEESLELSRDKLDRKIQRLKGRQNARSPFLIGSIEEVSNKISKLDRKLQSYTELVVESRASDSPEYKPPPSAKGREKYLVKERDGKELTKFAGIYAVKSTFGVGTSERVKNISKISMNPSKTNVKRDNNKPKFVELHQYPGYDATEITPLPDEVPAIQILKKVSSAQVQKKVHPSYSASEFDKLMHSQMSQAILVDTFWWYFLEKFQADREAQSKLFNRVAHNYVKLLLYCKDPALREIFLKDYSDILAQGVYAAFCEAFPDSYRQFNVDFKEDLISLVSQWVVGLKPAPRTWMKWNLDMLEPANIKVREEMSKNNKAGKKLSSLNFDYLDIASGPGSQHSSQTTLNVSGSVKSSREALLGKKNGNGSQKSSSGSSASTQDFIEKVADAQVPQKSILKRTGIKKDLRAQVMSPIVETKIEAPTPTPSTSLTVTPGGRKASRYWNPSYNTKRESHPACRGPEFVKYVFNIQGQSPLVAHFLKKKNLKSKAGTDVKVQRTEIKSLPSLEERTYMDIISEGYKKVKERSKECQDLFERGKRGSADFIKRLHQEQKLILDRQTAVLSNPRGIKRLSNLIILEQRKDQDSITAGASAAMDAALKAGSPE